MLTKRKNNSNQVKRRVVSKPEYARYLARKAGLSSTGVTLALLGIAGVILTVCVLLSTWLDMFRIPLSQTISATLFSGIIGSVCWGLYLWGWRNHKKAQSLEAVQPLTRQSAEQLPAEQSLVRASSEPSEAQQAILLRAASSNLQTPSEELLRAVTQSGDTQA
jgi:hypothetical protein